LINLIVETATLLLGIFIELSFVILLGDFKILLTLETALS